MRKCSLQEWVGVEGSLERTVLCSPSPSSSSGGRLAFREVCPANWPEDAQAMCTRSPRSSDYCVQNIRDLWLP